MSKQLTYKLAKDVRNGILVCLDDFLALPEVKANGITKENCKDFIILSLLKYEDSWESNFFQQNLTLFKTLWWATITGNIGLILLMFHKCFSKYVALKFPDSKIIKIEQKRCNSLIY